MVDHLGIGMTMLDVVHDVPDLGGSTAILAKWIIDISHHHRPASPQATPATLTIPDGALGAWELVAEQRRLQITAGTTDTVLRTPPTKPHCSVIPSPSTKY